MASVEKRLRNGKTRWYVRYRTPAGDQRTKTFDRKVDALDYLTTVEGSKLVGGYIDPRRSSTPVGEWADQWLQTKLNVTPKTRERYEGIVRSQIKTKWGNVKLADVEHAKVQAWVADLASTMAPASVTKVHRVFSQILKQAVHDGRLARNPAEGITLPRVARAPRRYLTHLQVQQLAEACGPGHRRVVLFLAYTGVRWGEMAALRVRNVDLQRRRVTIAESVTPVGGVMTFGETKGHEHREVPIVPFLVAELEDQIAGKGPDDLVFTGTKGAVMRTSTFRRSALTPAAIRLGLATDSGKRTAKDEVVWTDVFHPHELRHTAASLAIASGADVKVVQQMLGHKSAAMTLDQYGHLFGDRLDVVADAMEAARSAALAEAARADREGREGGPVEDVPEGSTPADVYPLCTRPDLRVVGK